MLRMKTLPLGAYQTNCYLVWDEESRKCIVIDPGYDPETVLAQVKALGKTVEAILLTHGHFDHVGGVRTIAEETGCTVYLHEADLSQPEYMTAGPLYYTKLFGEGDVLSLAGLTVRVLHTPGHTPGCVCLLAEDSLFSGDTLFQGSCGRTDFPGGDGAVLLRSLKRLAAMDKELAIYPGHGPATTLAEEKMYNPYLRET